MRQYAAECQASAGHCRVYDLKADIQCLTMYPLFLSVERREKVNQAQRLACDRVCNLGRCSSAPFVHKSACSPVCVIQSVQICNYIAWITTC